MVNKILDCKIYIDKSGIHPIPLFTFRNIEVKTDFILYVLKDKTNFVYVGITKQKIQTRFGGSFYAHKNKHKKKQFNSYTGYKWISDYQKNQQELTLYIFEIGDKRTQRQSAKTKLENKIFAESIESELAFIIRTETGNWPIYQHEIHFHNNKESRLKAKEIFNLMSDT